MNKYINELGKEYLKQYADVYIINLENVKPIKSANPTLREQLDQGITKNVDTIIKLLKLKNVSLLGRSAGGGIAIRLAINKYIVGLNLACPGHKSTGMEEFINYHKLNKTKQSSKITKKENNKKLSKDNKKLIPIVISWSKEDPRISIEEGYKMKKQLEAINYPKFKFIELSTGSNLESVNHRIHPELIKSLDFLN